MAVLTAESIAKAIWDRESSEDSSANENETEDDEPVDGEPDEESMNDAEREGDRQRAVVGGEPSTRAGESEEESNESDDHSEESAGPEEESEQSGSDTPLPKTRATRKRKRQPDKWKKTRRKKRRNSGRKYISSVNKQVSRPPLSLSLFHSLTLSHTQTHKHTNTPSPSLSLLLCLSVSHVHNTFRFQLSSLLQQTAGVQISVFLAYQRTGERLFSMVFGTRLTSMSKTLICAVALKLFK